MYNYKNIEEKITMQLIITRMNQLNMHVSDLLEQKKKWEWKKKMKEKARQGI